MLYHDHEVKFFRTRRRVLAVFFALFFIFAFLAVIRIRYFGKPVVSENIQTYADVKQLLREVRVVTLQKEVPLLLEVADTAEKRSQGLMFRRIMAKNSGMLFIFPEDTRSPFWMKNTLIPLDILFVTQNGSIVDFATMEPCANDPCALYGSSFPYRYAIEVSKDFIREHQVRRGDTVRM